MDIIPIYFDKKARMHFVEGTKQCCVCKEDAEEVLVININWKAKHSMMSPYNYYCKVCSGKRIEAGLQTTTITALIVDSIPKTAEKIMPMPVELKTGNISTFEAAELSFGGVTIDHTKYANRTEKMQQINMEKYQKDVMKAIEEKDKPLGEQEALDFLDSLKEAVEEKKDDRREDIPSKIEEDDRAEPITAGHHTEYHAVRQGAHVEPGV